MKVLVFDTETTGLPKKGASLSHPELFPYIVQISWLVFDFHALTQNPSLSQN